jgi:hypothetical protein
MQEGNNGLPIYYDGSAHLVAAVSNELADTNLQEDAADNEDWRRFVGFNPYGV